MNRGRLSTININWMKSEHSRINKREEKKKDDWDCNRKIQAAETYNVFQFRDPLLLSIRLQSIFRALNPLSSMVNIGDDETE